MTQVVSHPTGNYAFLPGIAPYSCGVVSEPGYEIVQVTLNEPVPYQAGFTKIAEFLDHMQRPKAALCAMALRSPRPFTFSGFSQFNAEYAAILQEWDVFVDGVNPVARTNVAPVMSPPKEPSLYAFSFSRPVATKSASTFVVAGAGELPEGKLDRESIVALGDTSSKGLRIKADFVLGLMNSRLQGLGVSADAITTIDVYTAHPLDPLLAEPLLNALPTGRRIGVQWNYTRPPIEEIEFEMDLRGVRTELRL